MVWSGYISHSCGTLKDRFGKSRLKGRSGIARALYVTRIGQRVVVVRVFVKKTEKTPRSEIEKALQRAEGLT
jgi:phage-related protein